MKPRIVIQFAVTAKEKRAIQRAAKRAGMSVSQWLRFHAQAQAAKSRERENRADVAPEHRVQVVQ
jgi:uncharacterized protein (DUF1778 family)